MSGLGAGDVAGTVLILVVLVVLLTMSCALVMVSLLILFVLLKRYLCVFLFGQTYTVHRMGSNGGVLVLLLLIFQTAS